MVFAVFDLLMGAPYDKGSLGVKLHQILSLVDNS